MPTPNGELTPRELLAQFREMSLRELSTEAENLAQIIETSSDDEDSLFDELQQYLNAITEAKIDGYCWYHDILTAEIDEWKTKKLTLAQMCDEVIQHKEAQLNAMKQNLLRLASKGLIPHYLLGKNKAIEIRANSKPSVEVLCAADDPGFPEKFRSSQITYKPDKEAIVQAHESGQDVSGFATVTWGKQVRFKNAPRRKRQKTDE
ncbi:siphovirus Gp157 family protein [Crocosphaera sp. UHCC 0190]|uniref:siphovirus Gp157 family protein n=1 Tax=Crocosphaera sp. UHCC 0190 TaxID=3110246 RepID=UPI002B215FF7|nr:siphovirus Gp157 family protein [Crocosphaera sp. UHCC 0190]MEA5512254.1 siphovirus Gp157 family protein [Crocosphaera sp. UHCC 0190]